MSLRCARFTGPAVLALFIAASGLLGGGAVPRAGAASGPAPPATALSLVGQSPWVQPPSTGGPATFTVEVAVRPGTPPADQVVATLYDQLTTRSAFEQTLAHTPASKEALDRTHPVALSAMPAADGGYKLTVSVLPQSTTAPAAANPTLVLTCVPDTGRCTGVYPVVVALLRPSGGVVAHLTTYLTYVTGTSTHRLGFSWVVPIAASPSINHGSRDPAAAVSEPSAATAQSLTGLVTSLGAHPAVPVTVGASPQTLQSLDRLGSRDGGAPAVQELAAMSADNPSTRQVLSEPYVPIDLGALAGAGEGGEVTAQMQEGISVLQTLKVQVTPSAETWVATGTVGSDLRTGMSMKGVDATRLVLPDADLAPPGSTSGTWASAFGLSLSRGAPVAAAASDGELAVHFTADTRDPALEANQLLADLAMIHFEEPNTPTPRAVVAVPPAGWVPSRAFDTALLAGLTANPVVQATTLAGFFSEFPDGSSASRRLATGGGGPVLSAALAHSISNQRLRLTAFDTAVRGTSAILTQLDQLLLTAESDDLDQTAQSDGVDTFDRSLDAQLSLIQLATARTITLTARTGFIPVTIVSTARYTVVGRLTLTGGRFEFPHGSTRKLTLDHTTNPVRIDVEARTSGDLPLEVTFQAPNGQLVIASGQLTVRSTATSLVGVVLTGLALLVLFGWWARTWYRGRRRRAAQGRDAGGA